MNRLNSVIMNMVLEPEFTGPLLVGALNMSVSILGQLGCQEGQGLQDRGLYPNQTIGKVGKVAVIDICLTSQGRPGLLPDMV